MKEFRYQHIITETYLQYEAIVKEAMEYKLFVFLFADSGFGKTYTYSRLDKENVGVAHFKLEQTDRPLELYNKVISSFPSYDNYNSRSTKWSIAKASDLCNERKIPSVLIIDEANQFKPDMLGLIRQFRDKTEFSTGLVISGPTEFRDELQTWKNDKVKGINEIWTRKDDIYTIDEISDDDLKNVCIANNINNLDLINEFIYESEGNYRGLRKQIEKHYRKLGYKIIKDAA